MRLPLKSSGSAWPRFFLPEPDEHGLVPVHSDQRVGPSPHRRLTRLCQLHIFAHTVRVVPEKDSANRGKHGVSLSFGFGARVFEDADYLLIPTFREEDGEDRYKVIGMVDGSSGRRCMSVMAIQCVSFRSGKAKMAKKSCILPGAGPRRP